MRVRGGEAQPPPLFLPPSLSVGLAGGQDRRRRPLAGEGPSSPLHSLSLTPLSPPSSPSLSLTVGVAGGHPWPTPATEGRRAPVLFPPLSSGRAAAARVWPGQGSSPGRGLLEGGGCCPLPVSPLGWPWPPQRRRAAGASPAAGGRSRPGAV